MLFISLLKCFLKKIIQNGCLEQLEQEMFTLNEWRMPKRAIEKSLGRYRI